MKNFRQFCLVVASLLLTSNAFATLKVASVTGSVPRDLSKGYFDITVVVSDILPSDMTPSATELELFARLKIYLLKIDDDEAVPHNEIGTSQLGYYVDERNSYTSTSNDNGNNDVTFYLRIFAADTANGLQKLITAEGANQVSVGVDYDGGTGKTDLDNDFVIARAVGVANTAPSSVTVETGHKSLIVKWDYASSIAYKGGSDAAPSGATVYVVPNSASLSLNAKVYNADPKLETATTCTFSPLGGADGDCISCGTNDGNAYIDQTSLPADVKAANVSAGSATISGLDVGSDYVVFVGYEPDAVAFSSCHLGQPSVTYSYTEFAGEPEAEMKDPRCFIATAAFGSANDPQVLALRWVRDHIIRKMPGGERVVEAYYRYSEPVAMQLRTSQAQRAVVRAVLWIPVSGAIAARWSTEHPLLALNFLLLLLAAGCMYANHRSTRTHRP